MWKTLALLVAAVLAGCTKRNPAVCCVTADNCDALGLPLPSPCDNGLACDGVNCIEPTCSRPSDCVDPTLPYCVDGICVACDTQSDLGCKPVLPVCDPVTTSCVACQADEDCNSHPGTPICSASGACIACMGAQDCMNPTPVCESGGCRACRNDAECGSGICDGDGTCVEPSKVVFVATTGIDSGSCTQTQPCATIPYATTQTSSARYHILVSPGIYNSGITGLGPGDRVHIHGYGATVRPSLVLTANGQDAALVDGGSLTISGLTIEQEPGNVNGRAIHCVNQGTLRIEQVRILVPYHNVLAETCSVRIDGSSFARNDNKAWAIEARSGTFEMYGSSTGMGGVYTTGSVSTLTNNLITGTGVRLFSATGTMSFNTIADTTLPSGSARAVECGTAAPNRPELFSNIIWVPNGTTDLMISACRNRDNLIGPIEQPGGGGGGNFNMDPQFVGPGNYHLRPTSPAVDKASTGPAIDRDGEPRPQGVGWDLGADEVR
ncbi:MAG: choice-of-anchor Q domain-containing protein [Kofleriaceae bacterium]